MLVVLVLDLFTPFFVKTLLAPGFDAPMIRLTTGLTRIMLIQPLILVVGSVATVETLVLAAVLLVKLRNRVRFPVMEVVPATGNDTRGT